MNRLQINRNQLFTQAGIMAAGLHLKEAEAGIKQNTEAALRADLEAAKNADVAYNTALAADAAFRGAEASADADGKLFIDVAKRVLAIFLGIYWSPTWSPTGFTEKSLVTPFSKGKRQALLEALERYLQDHPDQQNAPLNVTAIRAGELFTKLKAARTERSSNTAMLKAAKQARDNTEQALRGRMSGLLAELKQLLDDDDPSWYAFGLNRPADRKTRPTEADNGAGENPPGPAVQLVVPSQPSIATPA